MKNGEDNSTGDDATTVTVPCEDGYEAQKLASLILVKDEKTGESQTFVKAVVNAIENEVVILLQDGSSHSILLQDEAAVDAFADFIQSITDETENLVSVQTQKAKDGHDVVTIAKAPYPKNAV